MIEDFSLPLSVFLLHLWSNLLFHFFHFMSRLSLIASLAIFMTVFGSALFTEAATTTTTTTTTPTTSTAAVTPTPLLLDTVIATDARTITLTFNQSIRVDSIRVRIIDQATNESIKVSSITGSTTESIATIMTAMALAPGASYVITITSALSSTDMTIKAGVDSIREFTAPTTLTGITLNAPPNPSAVIVATGVTTVVPKPALIKPTVATRTVGNIPQDTGALPQTGAPTVILILLAGLSAFGLLLFRKRA